MENNTIPEESLKNQSVCQRCGGGAGDNLHNRLQFHQLDYLSLKTKSFLEKTSYEWLCYQCLAHLDELTLLSEKFPFPHESHEVVKDIHYYKEKGYWVFTELYSMQRGYCCKNGCRHCAYGYTLKK